ncbi:hypothetical protein BU17DRAFT_92279 [Hysterangium stoloniferum]|nr:hypothetical protein BU17DRAFT_92279 [Hysterangium stoloniferum]
MAFQPDFGLGQAPADSSRQYAERRYFSTPTSAKDEFGVTVLDAAVGTAAKKRKALELTPENVDKVLTSSFDLQRFHEALDMHGDLEMTPRELFSLMKSCVFEPNVIVSFSNVQSRHLESLGLDLTSELEFDRSLERVANAPNSRGNMYLQQTSLDHVQKHFNLTSESGARCIIDQLLVAGVIYAQAILDDDRHKSVRAEILKRHRINNPRVAVFTELPIPYTKLPGGLAGGQVPFNANKTLAGIIEAKSLDEFRNAESQITVQVLTILAVTKRKVFTGALTNGAFWRFYTAYDGDTQIRIYASGLFEARENHGLIVEYLKDMILYPISPMVKTDLAKVPEV